ncbi:DUF11 domain-containing protein [Streptomyces sp. NPDC001508]|uniref:DUF11 domain-containing protein n=1 Tax=Streptomyces sp. NPDC001508 TaxID=3154656 RepID=UPI0033241E95
MTGGSLGLLGAPHAFAAPASDGFECDGQIFQSAGSTSSVKLYTGTVGPGTVSFSPLGPTGPGYNAIGVDPDTQYIFAMRRDNNHLLQINNTGAVKDLGPIAGLPSTANYYIGGFDKAGDFYIAGNGTPLYKVDTKQRKVVSETKLSAPLGGGVGDITYASGFFWSATIDGVIQRINPTTGKVDNFSGMVPAAKQGYGGAITYGNNDLGFFDNGGTLYRIAVQNPGNAAPTFTLVSSQEAAAASAVDAAACFVARADLEVVKVGPLKVNQGDPVEYTITVMNNGPADSSGWTVNDTLPAGLQNPSTPTPGCTIDGSQLSCTGGALAVGKSATITVKGTAPVPGGVTLDNVATVRGNDPDPKPENNTSKTTTEVDVPLIDPAVGTATAAGLGALGTVILRRRRNTGGEER